jgi:hypothetical protein
VWLLLVVNRHLPRDSGILLQGLGNKHLVWRRQFGYGAGVGIYAIANAGTRVDNRTCAHAGANDSRCSTDAGTHVGNHISALTGTNDDRCGPNAGTHVDVQL